MQFNKTIAFCIVTQICVFLEIPISPKNAKLKRIISLRCVVLPSRICLLSSACRLISLLFEWV